MQFLVDGMKKESTATWHLDRWPHQPVLRRKGLEKPRFHGSPTTDVRVESMFLHFL